MNTSLPCPIGPTARPFYITKNELGIFLVQRLLLNGKIRTIAKTYKTYAGASNRAYHCNLTLKERGEYGQND